jgi:hypothetical protein
MDETPTRTPASDMTAAPVVARSNEEIMARLNWLVRRATDAEEEILALLHELNRRRACLPPSPPT